MGITSLLALAACVGHPAFAALLRRDDYLDWSSFDVMGVNLGGWLHQEQNIDPGWWDQHAPGTVDEWDFCVALGSNCGSVLEKRYATYITTKDIDTLAEAGINVIRVPLGYNAWVEVPGSQLYHGNQVSFLKSIADYAWSKHGIHTIIDIHSLPGGLNGMGLGEKEGNFGWFQNETALEYSYQAVEAAIDFIQSSDHPEAFTLAPINEPVDNRDFSKFGTPEALTEEGAAWVLQYLQGVLTRVQAANPSIPVMLQGSFKPEEYWSPNFPDDANVVFDVHNYYFAGRPTTSENIPQFICEDARNSAGDGRFPVVIGEWSIQAASNNTFDSREVNLNTGLGAWSQYTQGSIYWTYKSLGTETVDGEGTLGDYWNFSDFIAWDWIDPSSGQACD
ncbi:hypothetical protein VUR80DRAFT_1153 [Thermomyces stellatus]